MPVITTTRYSRPAVLAIALRWSMTFDPSMNAPGQHRLHAARWNVATVICLLAVDGTTDKATLRVQSLAWHANAPSGNPHEPLAENDFCRLVSPWSQQ